MRWYYDLRERIRTSRAAIEGLADAAAPLAALAPNLRQRNTRQPKGRAALRSALDGLSTRGAATGAASSLQTARRELALLDVLLGEGPRAIGGRVLLVARRRGVEVEAPWAYWQAVLQNLACLGLEQVEASPESPDLRWAIFEGSVGLASLESGTHLIEQDDGAFSLVAIDVEAEEDGAATAAARIDGRAFGPILRIAKSAEVTDLRTGLSAPSLGPEVHRAMILSLLPPPV